VAATVRSEDPDIILLDYNMPSIKGDDLCIILKRNTSNPDLKIVIFSSESESDLVNIVRRCGADGYVQKNVAGHILLQHIDECLSGTVN
jgi:DNA-binding NarL/FixJ family response regulator